MHFASDAPTGGRNERWIQVQPSPGSHGFQLRDRALDIGENQLSGGAALAGGSLMQPAVEFPRQINAGSDAILPGDGASVAFTAPVPSPHSALLGRRHTRITGGAVGR